MLGGTVWIDVPGGRIAAEDDGAGPPVVLVHSAIVNRRAWDTLTPLLVDAGYRVIRYDMRGFGESTAEAVEFSPRDDLRAVMDARGVAKAVVIGNSWGAMNALDAVIESPDRFAALGWLGGGVGGFEGGNTPEEQEFLNAEGKAEEEGRADAAADLDVHIWVDGVGQPPTRVPAAIRDAVRAMDREIQEPGRQFGTNTRLEPRANERLDGLAVPVLAVVGALDTSGTRKAARRLADAAPNVRLEEWPDVAHMIAMEQPERLAALLVEFLGQLPRWG
ncbi:MAG TPA: alpha/beta hydrolase [Patescibacteria group bacterium]|nr:alpha/beta hydrolase [Patescibacteria group bacterium]